MKRGGKPAPLSMTWADRAMATTIHLVRHGHHSRLGLLLCGRMPGVEIDELGRREISGCCELLASPPTEVQSSPQRRAVQSAEIIASCFGLGVVIAPAADEIDVGDWTSLSFQDLVRDPEWHRWNSHRAVSRPPHGESMRSLQRRMVGHLESLCGDSGTDTVVLVSHAEPIRAALLHYLGMSLNDFLSIDVDPGGVSTLRIENGRVRVADINRRTIA
jgi:broad specificity phosphatase PhoE